MRLPKLRAPWLRVSEGRMQEFALGRLPPDVAAAERPSEPAPEYIAQAAPVSEEVWARAQARYRERHPDDAAAPERAGSPATEDHSPAGGRG